MSLKARGLEPILQLSRERGWLKARGKQRSDATAVLAGVRALSSLESVGESRRAALNALAKQQAEWVGTDVAQLLTCIDEPQTPQAVRELAEVALLRQVFAQHYEQQGQQVHWRDGPAVSNEDRIV